jgi:carbon storage regulator
MLVVTRRESEIIRIDKDIVVEVLVINGDKVKIGIKAPKSVSVMRGELDSTGPCRKVIVEENHEQ